MMASDRPRPPCSAARRTIRPAAATQGWRHVLLGALLALPCTPALAKIDIDIPDVTTEVANNVRAFLSLTRYAERKDVTPEVMGRLQRRIVSETRSALEPLGYYDPEVTYDAVHNGEDWKVTLHVTPGRPVRLSEVHIDVTGEGRNAHVIREIIDAKTLKPGLRLNHGAYESVKDTLLRVARNDGYLDAQLTRNELLIDRTERRATVELALETGKRYYYGTIATDQTVINDDAMRRLLRMKTGDAYTLDSLLRTQYVLDDSQYFRNVDIESGDADREAHTVPITIKATPNRRHKYSASIGYATDTRERGQFSWDDRRVNDRGHRARVDLTGSSILNSITGRYVIPVMDVALEKLEFGAGITDEELGSTRSQREELSAGLTQVLGRWQRVLFVTFSEERTTLPATETEPEQKNNAFLIIPGVSFAMLPSYVLGTRMRPYSIYAELRGSPSSLGSDSSFLQFRAQAERIFTFSELWSLRLRGELGASWLQDEFVDLPASQRFFAGGDRSVRGFGLNELSPKDSAGNTIGGRNLITGTIEVERRLPRNFGVAAFYDFGNAFDHFSDPLEYSVGVGVRWHIAVASLGIDVAQPLSEPGRNPRLHLYISTLF